MATRSIIAIEHNDEANTKFLSIYCHFDGYPSHVGKLLVANYNSAETVTELINLGDLSAITSDGAIAYHRDRGENWNSNAPKLKESWEELVTYGMSCDAEYVYVFNGDEWECFDVYKSVCIDLY